MATLYCTIEDVLTAGNIFRSLTTEETNRVNTAISQATTRVETMTGSFFYNQHLQITTEATNRRTKKIFLPAPCISIDNDTITENGVTLALNTDFLLYQPTDSYGNPKGLGWMEKMWLNAGTNTQWDSVPGFWTWNQQAIVISGQFGYATVPEEITKLTAWLAAQLMGWVTFAYTEADGVSKASVNLKMPEWLVHIKRNWTREHYDEQFFNFVVLT
jgi:hypothetical protein